MTRIEYVDRRTGDLYRTYDLDPEREYLRAIDCILYLYNLDEDGNCHIYHIAQGTESIEDMFKEINGQYFKDEDVTAIVRLKVGNIREYIGTAKLPELDGLYLQSAYDDNLRMEVNL